MESTVIKKRISWGSMILLGAVLGISLQYASAAWTAPVGTPPAGNVSGPITTGGDQVKTGKLQTAPTADPDHANTVVTKGYLEANYVNAADPGQPVRGGHYGSCFQQKNASQTTVWSSPSFTAWPITNCPSTGSGTVTCAAGYQVAYTANTQLNTGAYGVTRYGEGQGGFPAGVSKYNDQMDTYMVMSTCVKL